VADSNIKIIASLFLRKSNQASARRRRSYYLMRFRSQASLISQTTIINMVSTTIGAVNVANVVSIVLQPSERRCPKRAAREFVPRSLRIFAGWKWATIQLRVALAKVVNEKTRRQSIGARVPGMYGGWLYGCATPNAARSQDLQGMQRMSRQGTCCG
jgi:hypothetical protein